MRGLSNPLRSAGTRMRGHGSLLRSAGIRMRGHGNPLRSVGIRMRGHGILLRSTGIRVRGLDNLLPSAGIPMRDRGRKLRLAGFPLPFAGILVRRLGSLAPISGGRPTAYAPPFLDAASLECGCTPFAVSSPEPNIPAPEFHYQIVWFGKDFRHNVVTLGSEFPDLCPQDTATLVNDLLRIATL